MVTVVERKRMLQCAVLPGREQEWVVAGSEAVGGYVVDAADARWADTPDKLLVAHALLFPGSPLHPGMPFIDVIRFEPYAGMNFVRPFGRDTEHLNSTLEGEFVEHPPFRGLGFNGDDVAHHTPVWWLDPARFPPAAELWRIHASGAQDLLAVFTHVADGWVPQQGVDLPQTFSVPPSDVLGTFGTYRGSKVLVDLLGDGGAVIGVAGDVPGWDLTRGRRDVWWRSVRLEELSDVSAMRLTCTWRGLPFQVLSRIEQNGVLQARVVYIGRNALTAEHAQLRKMDAGWYEAYVPMSELEDGNGVETVRLAADPPRV